VENERYLCVDVGGTAIKYGLLTRAGEVLSGREYATSELGGAAARNASAGDVADFFALLENMAGEFSSASTPLAGLCISTTGIVDPWRGEIAPGSNNTAIEGYGGAPLRDELQRRTGLPVEIENDVNCAALGEYWLGAARSFNNVVCVAVGTGIGGALILDGRLYRGSRFNAMETGHIPFFPSNWENRASTRALTYDYARRSHRLPSELDGRFVLSRAREGEDAAVRAVDEMCFYLAQGIATLFAVLAPDIFVLGGGVAESADFLLPRIESHLERTLDPRFRDNVVFKAAELGNRAGLLGALRHFLDMKEARKIEQEERETL